MNWVLIVAVSFFGEAGGITSVPMDSQARCEAAQKAVKEQDQGRRLVTACVQVAK